MISIRGLSKSYVLGNRNIPVLENLSLEVAEGELVAVMGSSGSGKSTLLNILGLLDGFEGGEYFLDGIDVSHFSERQRAHCRSRRIGFVFQNFNLLPFKTALENVMLPLHYQGLGPGQQAERAREALAWVDLLDREDHLPSELSGGQCQRVAIARAIATRPSVILADEPTGALDSATAGQIIEILRRLHADGHTILIVTHEQPVAAAAHRTIQLRDGRIVRDLPNPAPAPLPVSG